LNRHYFFVLASCLSLSSCGDIDSSDGYVEAAGLLESSFMANLGSGFNGPVDGMALQSDSKIIVIGRFTQLNGESSPYLARLNENGSPDPSFALGLSLDAPVFEVKVDGEDRVYIAGAFQNSVSQALPYFVRLSKDGLIDQDFLVNLGAGFDAQTTALSLDDENSIFIGGDFLNFKNQSRSKFIKLLTDGTEDLDFSSTLGSGFNLSVSEVLTRPDNTICVGGAFTLFNSISHNRLLCFLESGEVDTQFKSLLGGGFNGTIRTLASRAMGDTGLLIGGNFEAVNSLTRKFVAEIEGAGAFDHSSALNISVGPDADVYSILVNRADSQVFSGDFCQWSSVSICRMLRLKNGAIDQTFLTNLGSGFDQNVRSLLELPSGKMLVGGEFLSFNGAAISTHMIQLK